MKLMVFAIVCGSVLSACSSYNHIQYRNNKHQASKPVKHVEKETIAELAIEQKVEQEIGLTTNETQIDLATTDRDEELISGNISDKKIIALVQLKASKTLLANVVEKIIELPTKVIDEPNEKPSKSEYRKRFDLFHWILMGLFVLFLVLVLAALANSGNKILLGALIVIAAVVYLVGFVIAIIQNYVLPHKITGKEKDGFYRRRKAFALTVFILALVALGIALTATLLLIAIQY